jgi:hypothetical protein
MVGDADYGVAAVATLADRLTHPAVDVAAARSYVPFRRAVAEPRILIMPQRVGLSLEQTDLRGLGGVADFRLFDMHGDAHLLAGRVWGADLARCVAMARPHLGSCDLIIGECIGAFLWHSVFRLAGDATLFAIIPHFDHLAPTAAYALLLSSQLALPHDKLFAGSRVACGGFA